MSEGSKWCLKYISFLQPHFSTILQKYCMSLWRDLLAGQEKGVLSKKALKLLEDNSIEVAAWPPKRVAQRIALEKFRGQPEITTILSLQNMNCFTEFIRKCYSNVKNRSGSFGRSGSSRKTGSFGRSGRLGINKVFSEIEYDNQDDESTDILETHYSNIICFLKNKGLLDPLTCQNCNKEIKVAKKLWYNASFEYYKDQYNYNTLLGNSGEVVEVDECSFRRKYNRGRILKTQQQWILGLTERNRAFSRTMLFPIKSRDKDTLLKQIKKYVSPRCKMIVKDCWTGYRGLTNHRFTYSVNHSQNFVAPKTNNNHKNINKKKGRRQTEKNNKKQNHLIIKGEKAHTQKIENYWCHSKDQIRQIKEQIITSSFEVYQKYLSISQEK
ncbi:hypothetical protein ABPG72_019928 [Tetrahymena utriculariae]